SSLIAVISHKHKCIFVEVPKTGSTSVRAILGKAWRPHLNLWQIRNQMETYWTRYGGRKNRILAALYLLLAEERRREIGRKQFETYFKFGFVRNPWDRVVSLYERTEALQLRDKMTFDEFVDWIQYSSATCVHSSPHRYQLDWFVDPNGNVLTDFIGKFERLDEDWAFVAQKLGVSEKLPHRRENPRVRHYSEYYTSRTRDKIASLISHAMRSPEVDGLLFCRCRATLNNPKLTLYPRKVKNPFGDVYFERKAWFQIWIHQILRAKVLRYLFTHLPDHIPSA